MAGRSSSIQFGYDAAHRLTVLVNENRQAYQFQYDRANRLVQETRIDGTRQALHMDAAGQVVGVTEYPVLGDVVMGHAPVQPIHTQLIRDKAGQLILRTQEQYLDRETGLHVNTFRCYDPDLGAFTSSDPIG